MKSGSYGNASCLVEDDLNQTVNVTGPRWNAGYGWSPPLKLRGVPVTLDARDTVFLSNRPDYVGVYGSGGSVEDGRADFVNDRATAIQEQGYYGSCSSVGE